MPMVSVVELVDTPDCGSGAAALRVQVSSLTPYRGFVQRLGLQSPKLSMGVRISHPLPILFE